jgi:voltage-gated potassium channel Kch
MMGGIDPDSEVSAAAEAWDDHAFKVISAAALIIVTSGTVAFHYLEDWSWVDSLYFSVVAVTTVGFGDLVPTTDAAKLFTVVYVLAGIAVLGLFLNERLRRGQHRRRVKAERRRDDPNDD